MALRAASLIVASVRPNPTLASKAGPLLISARGEMKRYANRSSMAETNRVAVSIACCACSIVTSALGPVS